MSQLVCQRFSWTPLGGTRPILNDISIQFSTGERVLVVGASGSGKSTLLRAFAGILDAISPGEAAGKILVDDQPPVAGSGKVVLVGQQPADAIVAATVGRDIAFGPENLSLPVAEIWKRVDESLASVDFPYDTNRATHALSGGQQQRLALAGALAMHPAVLALDEPVAMLDQSAATELRTAIAKSAQGSILIVADHDIAGWLGLVDRLVVLSPTGSLLFDGPIHELLVHKRAELLALGLWVPGSPPPDPITVDQSLVTPQIEVPKHPLTATNITLIRRSVPGLRVANRRTSSLALDHVDTQLTAGEILGLYGPSGAGKSSLLTVLCGLLKPTSGELSWPHEPKAPWNWESVALAQHLGWVPQFTESAVTGATVLDSILTTPRILKQDESAARNRALTLLSLVGLAEVADRHPLRLSGGEQRRLALLNALIHGPAVLALDEPTVGLDRQAWAAITGIILAAKKAGVAVVVASHDQYLLDLANTTQLVNRPEQPPTKPPRLLRGLLSRTGPLALLTTVFVFLLSGLFVNDLTALSLGVGLLLVVGPLLTWFRFPLIRLLPALIGIVSITWSNWLLSPTHSGIQAAIAGLRVAFIALPGIVVVSYLDPVELGDQLGQLLRIPGRVVLALTAALQRLDDMHERWVTLEISRRARGLLPGRSPIARIKHGISLLFSLLIDAVRQAERLTIAMETRGYSIFGTSGVNRTWAVPTSWTKTDTIFVLLTVALAISAPVITIFI